MLEPEPEEVGLCLTCRHARRVPTPEAVYWLCRLSASDPAFERYPRLPVRRCAGYRRADAGVGEEAGGR